jgi:hypothetical protein
VSRRVSVDEQRQHGEGRADHDDPAPPFASFSATGLVGRSVDGLLTAVAAARSVDPPTARESLAFGLFSASFFERSGDARLVTLVTAVETLIECGSRPDAVVKHINDLIAQTTPPRCSGARSIRSSARCASCVRSRSRMRAGASPPRSAIAATWRKSRLRHFAVEKHHFGVDLVVETPGAILRTAQPRSEVVVRGDDARSVRI